MCYINNLPRPIGTGKRLTGGVCCYGKKKNRGNERRVLRQILSSTFGTWKIWPQQGTRSATRQTIGQRQIKNFVLFWFFFLKIFKNGHFIKIKVYRVVLREHNDCLIQQFSFRFIFLKIRPFLWTWEFVWI